MKFKKEELRDMVFGDSEKLVSVEDEITDTGRWCIYHSVIFKDVETGKHYESSYSVGSTECQDERPYEYADDEVECIEVEQKEVKVIKWVEVKEEVK